LIRRIKGKNPDRRIHQGFSFKIDEEKLASALIILADDMRWHPSKEEV